MSRAEWLNFFLTSFISLFAIVNPLGNATLFISLTEGCSDRQRRRAAIRAAITSLLILLVFIFLGKQILTFFRITIPAFQIAGGILIFIIGVTMLHAFRLWVKSTPTEEQAWAEKQDVGVIPLGIPILSGPGAITTAMVLAVQQPNLEARAIVCAAAVLVCLIAFLVFSQSTYLMRLLGDHRRQYLHPAHGTPHHRHGRPVFYQWT